MLISAKFHLYLRVLQEDSTFIGSQIDAKLRLPVDVGMEGVSGAFSARFSSEQSCLFRE